jgi:hypothetical protein
MVNSSDVNDQQRLTARLASIEDELARLTLDRFRLPEGLAEGIMRDQMEDLQTERDQIRIELGMTAA